MLTVHHIICAAICFARNYRDLWYRCLAVGVEQLRAVPDNTVVFLAYAR